MIDEQDVRDWEQLPLPSSIITSQHFGAWLYYRDKRRDKRVNSELLDKVAEKIKDNMCSCSFKGTELCDVSKCGYELEIDIIHETIDKVIAEMKER